MGTVTSNDLCDSYGARTNTGGTDVFGFGAQDGYYTDTETGLTLCTHCFYDPLAGRWLTRDPISYSGGINLYEYVGNNPTNDDDPEGYAGNADYCKKLQKTITNAEKRIGRRIDQLHNDGDDPDNPVGLPEHTKDEKTKPSESRWGHRYLINKDKALLEKLKWLAWEFCNDPMPPM